MLSEFFTRFRLLAGIGTATALATPAFAETVHSEPSGVMTAQLAAGTHPLSFPLIRTEIFTAVVAGNAGSEVTFASGNLAEAMVTGEKYYLEVVTGALAGDRLDLASASGALATVALGAGTHSTVSSLNTDALAGARVVVRQHVSLKSVAAMFTPALVGHNSAALADQVLVYQNGGLASYYLRGDGVSWREPGKTADQRNRIVPPDASVLIQLKSGARRWTHQGAVRANDFRVNLTAGTRPFSSGFPINLSFIDVGGFVDGEVPVGVRWTGSDQASAADSIQIYNAAMNSFETYYLRGDGRSWQRVGDGTDRSSEEKLEGRSMLLIKRANADADYLIVRPYPL